jgi:hypothetical protein
VLQRKGAWGTLFLFFSRYTGKTLPLFRETNDHSNHHLGQASKVERVSRKKLSEMTRNVIQKLK